MQDGAEEVIRDEGFECRRGWSGRRDLNPGPSAPKSQFGQNHPTRDNTQHAHKTLIGIDLNRIRTVVVSRGLWPFFVAKCTIFAPFRAAVDYDLRWIIATARAARPRTTVFITFRIAVGVHRLLTETRSGHLRTS